MACDNRFDLENRLQALEKEHALMTVELKKKSDMIKRHLLTLKREGRATAAMDRDKMNRAQKVCSKFVLDSRVMFFNKIVL